MKLWTLDEGRGLVSAGGPLQASRPVAELGEHESAVWAVCAQPQGAIRDSFVTSLPARLARTQTPACVTQPPFQRNHTVTLCGPMPRSPLPSPLSGPLVVSGGEGGVVIGWDPRQETPAWQARRGAHLSSPPFPTSGLMHVGAGITSIMNAYVKSLSTEPLGFALTRHAILVSVIFPFRATPASQVTAAYGGICGLAVSDDGRGIIAACEDGALRFPPGSKGRQQFRNAGARVYEHPAVSCVCLLWFFGGRIDLCRFFVSSR